MPLGLGPPSAWRPRKPGAPFGPGTTALSLSVRAEGPWYLVRRPMQRNPGCFPLVVCALAAPAQPIHLHLQGPADSKRLRGVESHRLCPDSWLVSLSTASSRFVPQVCFSHHPAYKQRKAETSSRSVTTCESRFLTEPPLATGTARASRRHGDGHSLDSSRADCPEAPNKHTGPAQPLPTALSRPEQSGCRVLPGAGKVPRGNTRDSVTSTVRHARGQGRGRCPCAQRAHPSRPKARVSVHWGLPSVPWGPHSLKGASHGPAAGTTEPFSSDSLNNGR